MRIYQEQSLKSRSTPNVIEQNLTILNNNNNKIDAGQVRLRIRPKHLSPLTDRHSWSEYHLHDDNDNHLRLLSTPGSENRGHQRKGSFSLVKRSWSGSETKLTDIKEIDYSLEEPQQRLLYSRRNALSISHSHLANLPIEKKPERGWMGGIRRKLSSTVSYKAVLFLL